MADMDWDLFAWVKRSPKRLGIVRLLGRKPQTQPDLAAALDRKWGAVQHAMQPLLQRGVVVVLTSPGVRRGKVFGLTLVGRRIAKLL
jgi:DNA-binding MarR family transcriptional regulator